MNGLGWESKPLLGAGEQVQRRGLLRLGTLATAITGAFAVSAANGGRAEAAPGQPISEKELAATYVSKGALFLNVKDYGALGDGIADDSAAIQSAIDAAASAGSGIVHFPRGKYIVNSAITFPINKQISLRGSGMGGAGYTAGTVLMRARGTDPVISAVGTSTSERVSIELRDMEVHGGGLNAPDLVLIQRGGHIYLRNLRISHTTGTGLHVTEIWDSAFERIVVENCGTGTLFPATTFDSVMGAGSNANCATIHVTNSIWQGNTGTDIKLTGSVADGSPANEIQFVNCKMESGKGSQPFIDLDYAQSCSFVNVKILVPNERNPNAAVQQLNTAGGSIGTRANTFLNCTFDAAGKQNFSFDIAVGSLQSVGTTFVATPTVADVRVQSTVLAGRVRIFGPTPHGVVDLRTADEHLASSLGNGSLVGRDVTLWRPLAGQLKVESSNPNNGASFVVQGGASGTTNALQVVTPSGAATDSSFAVFNARARIGYDGTLAAVCIDDGNQGANKPIIMRSQGAARLTVGQGGDVLANTGNILVSATGKGFRVKEGANAKQGVVTLGSGTATVANSSVTASSRIILTGQDNNVTGALRVSARTPGSGFTISSSVGSDSGLVAYEIFEPA